MSISPEHPHVHVAIIGTGFAGLGMAVRLLQEGMEDFIVLERAEEVGGVWRDNRYPGAACDVESHLYTLSFAPNPDWSHRFSAQPEIWDYLRHVASQFGVLPHVRFRHEVTAAIWDDDRARWRIESSGGVYTSDVLVAAPGGLSEPRLPSIPGLDRFEGRALHSARWDEDLALAGMRVAVVGTGASAIQIIPAIQPHVEHLTVFQRTAPWVVPRRNRPLGPRLRRLLRQSPGLHRLARTRLFGFREGLGLLFRHPRLARIAEGFARLHLRRQVRDRALRRVLTPDYRFGCKRVLLSDDYYPALTQPNVTVVDGAAVEVRPGSVVGPGGREHSADAIIFATGFYVTEMPLARSIQGRDGRCLADVWGPSPSAYLGAAVAGFPNLFLLQGPNSGLGHTSVLLMIEAQIAHVINALRYLATHEVVAVEPREEVQAAFVDRVDRMAEGTVWTTGGCRSWYLDVTGRNAALWPGSVPAFRRRVEPFDPADYRLRPARRKAPAPPVHA